MPQRVPLKKEQSYSGHELSEAVYGGHAPCYIVTIPEFPTGNIDISSIHLFPATLVQLQPFSAYCSS